MRGRTKTDWWGVALDAPDALALARFYADLLGWPIAQQDADEAAIAVPGTSSYLAFKTEPRYVPPVWPTAGGHQQMMMHLDIAVDDLAEAVAGAIELGATVAGPCRARAGHPRAAAGRRAGALGASGHAGRR